MKTATATSLRGLGQSELYDHLRGVIEDALRAHRADNEASCARFGWSMTDFRFDDGDGRVNLLGVRGFSKDTMAPCPNTNRAWDDTCFVIWQSGGDKHVESYHLNTEQNIVDPDEDAQGGKSYLVNGNHRYRLGFHKGTRALEPASKVQTLWDKNQNFVDDDSPGGPQWIDSINIHFGGNGSTPTGWSLGCQTIRNQSDYDAFLTQIERDTSIIGSVDNTFAPSPARDGTRVLIYTLVDGSRLADPGAPTPRGERGDRGDGSPSSYPGRPVPDDATGPRRGDGRRNPDERPVLRSGSEGPAVRKVQERLAALGHDPGPIDGIFGSRTDTAVRSFQRARSLAVDGIVDSDTWEALRAVRT